jgi:hypothetical protein
MSIRDELLALKDKDGLFRVGSILEWAKKHRRSDLYGALEWDDAAAGHAWRCEQIRHLVRIHVVDVEGVRQLVSLTIDRVKPGGGYRDRSEVLAVPLLSEIMLADCLSELIRVRQKYIAISQLAGVWAAVDEAEQRQKERKSGRSKEQPQGTAHNTRRAKQA